MMENRENYFAMNRPGLLPREKLFGLAMAGTSGAAVLAHVFTPLTMTYSVPFIVMPATVVLLGLILVRRRLYRQLHVVADLLILGALTGFAATIGYDVIRPILRYIFDFSFNPFKAMPIFGSLMTGLPPSHPASIALGWVYHFWNGISFGMMFALVRPRGGALVGLLWGLGLHALMLWSYPRLLQVRLDDPGFLVTGCIGHAVWGVMLGLSIKKWGGKYA